MEADGGGNRRTAIVVVGGVGDLDAGTNAERVARGLLCHNRRRFAYSVTQDEEYAPGREWFGVRPQDQTDPAQTITRHTLYDHDRRPVVDVYEAWWADLSRFPGATRSALLASVGMFFQMTAVGRAALRGGPWLTGIARSRGHGRGGNGFPLAARLLWFLEWLVAVPIVIVTALHVALLVLSWYALREQPVTSWYTLLGLGGIAALLTAALLWGILRWYPTKRSGVRSTGLLLLGLAIAIAVWRGLSDGRNAARGIADSIFVLTAYPFRGAWMLVALLVLLAAPVIALTLLRDAVRHRRLPTHWLRRAGTAAISAMGPFGLAILGTLVYAAAGNALQALAKQSSFDGGAVPWCLQTVNDWTPGPCAPPHHGNPLSITAYNWGYHLFQMGLAPLLYVFGCAAAAVVLAVVLALVLRPLGRGVVAGVMLLAPWTLCLLILPAAALAVLTWLPLGDHVLRWQQSHLQLWNGDDASANAATTGAVVLGYVVTGAFAAARALKLGAGTLLNRDVIPPTVRIPLDLAYDISSFLREPRKPRSIAPRERMLARIAGVLDHVGTARPYTQTILFTHSQGTVLATAALHDPHGHLPVPGGRLTLLTMGSPLRTLYCERFPLQFNWVDKLRDDPRLFATRVDGGWYNFFAAKDLVGQRLFSDDGENPPPLLHQGIPHGDIAAGPGGHGSYYYEGTVFEHLGRLCG